MHSQATAHHPGAPFALTPKFSPPAPVATVVPPAYARPRGQALDAAESIASARRMGPALMVLAIISALIGPVTWFVIRYALDGKSLETLQLVARSSLAAEGLIGLTLFILLCVWVYRAHVALRRAGSTTTLSPGLAVGGWFIPFANLVLPFVAVRDAVRLGKSAAGTLVTVWWPLWLGFSVLHFARRMAVTAFETPQLAERIPDATVGRLLTFLDWSWIPDLAGGALVFGLLAVVAGLGTARRS